MKEYRTSNYEISTILDKQYCSDVANDSTLQEVLSGRGLSHKYIEWETFVCAGFVTTGGSFFHLFICFCITCYVFVTCYPSYIYISFGTAMFLAGCAEYSVESVDQVVPQFGQEHVTRFDGSLVVDENVDREV